MPCKLLALNVVGLTPAHLGIYTPNLSSLAALGECTHIKSMLPALTCSVQATYFTGVSPTQHGIVGNGWYLRDLCEVKFWHQSNRLIQAEQIWSTLRQRDPAARSANIFCWYNMYSPADISITVRPLYPAERPQNSGYLYLATGNTAAIKYRTGAVPPV
jgi:predicted AlkP superfamily pyrophosphatase or phosphodiesterase